MKSRKGTYDVYIGDVALDEYYRAERWPGTADKENVESLPAVPGGMIANAACVSASLGNKTMFCTVLNSGAITKLLLEDLNRANVDTSLTIYDDTLPDSKTIIFLVGDEHTIFIPELHIEKIELNDEQMDVLRNARFIYSSWGAVSLLRYHGMGWDEINDMCHENGVRVVCDYDVDYERNGDDRRFRNVDIGFFNETGYDSVRAGRSYEEQAEHLHSLGMKTVVVTLAEKGCVVYSDGRKYTAPARKVDVVDVTGAGDTFCSSFISVLDSFGIQKAAEFANAAASICISSLGARAGAVGFDKVMSVLEQFE